MMRILGHRGASADFPENTLESFRGAMAQGADGVELDVMRCGTGELVVCHDEWLSRLSGLTWEVARTPWWKLRRADVGSRLGFPSARIPLLEEVFEALPAGASVNVELKCETVDDGGLAVEVGRFLEARGLEARAFVSSFNPLCLVRLAKGFPRLKRGLLIDPDKAWLPQLAWAPVTAKTSIHPHWSAVTPNRVKAWHERGYEVAVWTVDDASEAKRLDALGVDWLITNRPAALRAALGRA
jgi:glycerophosphoryl diester phosphodiesterase